MQCRASRNELSRSKLVPKVVPPADKTATSRQELNVLHTDVVHSKIAVQILCVQHIPSGNGLGSFTTSDYEVIDGDNSAVLVGIDWSSEMVVGRERSCRLRLRLTTGNNRQERKGSISKEALQHNLALRKSGFGGICWCQYARRLIVDIIEDRHHGPSEGTVATYHFPCLLGFFYKKTWSHLSSGETRTTLRSHGVCARGSYMRYLVSTEETMMEMAECSLPAEDAESLPLHAHGLNYKDPVHT
ncbi:hypothetical protein Tco_0590799 [Tanacetum coccineum]